MKPTWTMSALVIVLLGAIAMLLIAASLPQPMFAQAPLTTPTLRQTLGPGGTLSPPAPTFTLSGPGEVQRPTAYRMPTQYVHQGPTVTPSGPLIALDTNRPVVGVGWEPDSAIIAKIYTVLPKSVGSVRLLTEARDTFSGQFGFGLEIAEQKGYFTGTVDFYGSQQQAYETYVIYLNGRNYAERGGRTIAEGRSVAVGDATFVAPQGRAYVAIMRYRNVFVQIWSGDRQSGDPAPFTLTEQQLTDVLAAIVKALDQQ